MTKERIKMLEKDLVGNTINKFRETLPTLKFVGDEYIKYKYLTTDVKITVSVYFKTDDKRFEDCNVSFVSIFYQAEDTQSVKIHVDPTENPEDLNALIPILEDAYNEELGNSYKRLIGKLSH